jgi:hypothetical protein
MQVRSSPPPPGWRWLALLPALCCLSCSSGPKLNPVQGKVLYNDQPLAGATVTFHPKEGNPVKVDRPYALTKEDGSFTLTTGGKEGAPAGSYVVTIICSVEAKPKGKLISTAPPETVDKLKGAYSDVKRSQIPVDIKDGPNQLEPFKLK